MEFSPELSIFVKLADAGFIAIAAMTLAGGLISVLARQIIHAVLGLVLALTGVAGLYAFLGNNFIAAMQMLIYVGAVSISMVFAVMLSRPPEEAKHISLRDAAKVAMGLIVAFFAASAIGTNLIKKHWEAASCQLSQGTPEEIGKVLLTRHIIAFELISLVLLVAIVGSVIIARRGRGNPVEIGESK
ncbi:NADH-quinone oxidoreductase subunit J [bacterium]|nr:MAG: NADH-quinone oxidoreductase subunit J [bacterium]